MWHEAWVTTGLNLRSSATTSGKPIRVLPRGQAVITDPALSFAANGIQWAVVRIGDEVGVVAEQYLTTTPVTNPPPPPPPPTGRIAGLSVNLDITQTTPESLSGLGYVRFVYDLSQNRGNRDFDVVRPRFDPVVARYITQGARPVFVLNHEFIGESTNGEFVWPTMTSADWDEHYTPLFCEYLARLVDIYGDGPVYQIGNQPDVTQGNYDSVAIPAANYGRLLSRAITTIRAKKPSATIISAGLQSGQTSYWRTAWGAVTDKRLDGVAIHAYGQTADGNTFGLPGLDERKRLVNLVSAYYSVTPIPVWVTEWGVTGPLTVHEPPQVNANSVEKYIRAMMSAARADRRIQAMLWFGAADYHSQNAYGLFDRDGRRKPGLWEALTA